MNKMLICVCVSLWVGYGAMMAENSGSGVGEPEVETQPKNETQSKERIAVMQGVGA